MNKTINLATRWVLWFLGFLIVLTYLYGAYPKNIFEWGIAIMATASYPIVVLFETNHVLRGRKRHERHMTRYKPSIAVVLLSLSIVMYIPPALTVPVNPTLTEQYWLNENVQITKYDDGRVGQSIYAGLMAYDAGDGKFQQIDPNIVTVNYTAWKYAVEKGAYEAYFTEDLSRQWHIGFVYKNYVLRTRFIQVGYYDASQDKIYELGSVNPNAAVSVTGNSITYENVYGQTDIRITYLNGKLKEELLIPEATVSNLPDPSSLGLNPDTTYLVGGQRLNLIGFNTDQSGNYTTNNIRFNNVSKALKFFFPVSQAWDSSGNNTAQVQYRVYRNSGNTYLLYGVPYTWISSTIGSVTIDPSTTLTPPSDDSRIRETAFNNNYGSNTQVLVSSWAGDDWRSLVLFDISSIPANITATVATLRLNYFVWAANDPVGRTYNAHRITASWAEGTVTWSNQPAHDGGVTDGVVVPASYGWMEWDVVSDLQDFVDGVETNYGWKLMDSVEDSGTQYNGYFYSKEFGSSEPELYVEYYYDSLNVHVFAADGTTDADDLTSIYITIVNTTGTFVQQPSSGWVNLTGISGNQNVTAQAFNTTISNSFVKVNQTNVLSISTTGGVTDSRIWLSIYQNVTFTYRRNDTSSFTPDFFSFVFGNNGTRANASTVLAGDVGNIQFSQTGLGGSTVTNTETGNYGNISVNAPASEAGGVAYGWFSQNFSTSENIILSFDVRVPQLNYSGTNEWLRIAVVGTLRHDNGTEYYTEMDFWDSPATFSGDIGDCVWCGATTREIKWRSNIDVNTTDWYHFDLNIMDRLRADWPDQMASGSGFWYWSSYVITEFDVPADGTEGIDIEVRDFRVLNTTFPYSGTFVNGSNTITNIIKFDTNVMNSTLSFNVTEDAQTLSMDSRIYSIVLSGEDLDNVGIDNVVFNLTMSYNGTVLAAMDADATGDLTIYLQNDTITITAWWQGILVSNGTTYTVSAAATRTVALQVGRDGESKTLFAEGTSIGNVNSLMVEGFDETYQIEPTVMRINSTNFSPLNYTGTWNYTAGLNLLNITQGDFKTNTTIHTISINTALRRIQFNATGSETLFIFYYSSYTGSGTERTINLVVESTGVEFPTPSYYGVNVTAYYPTTTIVVSQNETSFTVYGEPLLVAQITASDASNTQYFRTLIPSQLTQNMYIPDIRLSAITRFTIEVTDLPDTYSAATVRIYIAQAEVASGTLDAAYQMGVYLINGLRYDISIIGSSSTFSDAGLNANPSQTTLKITIDPLPAASTKLSKADRVYWTIVWSGGNIITSYTDLDALTSSSTLTIYEENSTRLFNEVFTQTYATTNFTANYAGNTSRSYYAKLDVVNSRYGSFTEIKSPIRSALGIAFPAIPITVMGLNNIFPFSGGWTYLLSAFIVITSAFIFSSLSSNRGAIVVAVIGTFLTAINWLPAVFAYAVVAVLIAVIASLSRERVTP